MTYPILLMEVGFQTIESKDVMRYLMCEHKLIVLKVEHILGIFLNTSKSHSTLERGYTKDEYSWINH
jgi:hypothetical protein